MSDAPVAPPAAALPPELDVDGGFSRVLVVDDEEALRDVLTLMLQREGYRVRAVASAELALEHVEVSPVDVVLTDVRMPGLGGLGLVDELHTRAPDVTVIVMSAFGSIDLALDAMRRGAYDYVSKPFKPDEIVLTVRKAEERLRLQREIRQLRARLAERETDAERLGRMLIHSAGMRTVAATVRKVAPFKTSVLVLGESGVGKELVSRAIHDHSPRARGPFVAVNCGAIPESLLESELFGHVKGAFTDASSDKRGLFEEAQGGTLFLDEVGELPPHVQVKLLRALQEEEIRRVGDTRSHKVDVRVVAATSRDLSQMVEEGTYRQDLYYRLNVLTLQVPALRHRKEDVAPLVDLFLRRTNERLGTRIEGITPAAMKVLLAYEWPGNVRELENTVEHAAVMADGATIDVGQLPERARRRASPTAADVVTLSFPRDDLSVKRAQAHLEREFILRALHTTGGNRTQAARLLDLSHRALLYKIKDFGLS